MVLQAQTEAKRAPSKPGRVAFTIKEFDNLIIDQGVKIRVTPSMLCPNITDLNTYNHDLNCTICDNGIIDLASQSFEDWAIIQGIKFDRKFEQGGVFDMKDAQITVAPNVRLHYWYKIEVIAFTSSYNQLIQRGEGGVFDKTRYIPQGDASLTPFYMIDKNGIEYTKDVEYEVSGQGINWLGVTKPADNEIFSFTYPMLPTYRVLELMHSNRFYYDDYKRTDKIPVHLPQQAHCRWDYLARGSGYENDAPTVPVGGGSAPPFKAGFNA